MKPLLMPKPLMIAAALLLIVQMACAASSISPTPKPGAAGAGSSNPTQSASGSQSTQASPFTGGQSTQPAPGGGSQTTQAAPSTGAQSTQSVPATGGQATQGVPSTGGQATQAMPTTSPGSQSTPADAQAMLNSVAQHYQTVGRQQALKDFTDKNAPFNSPNMFVMCIGVDHKISAMGGFPLLVGVSADSLNEITGQSLGNLIWDAASLQPQGSVPFQWKNPLSNQSESKVIFYQKLSQDVCGVVADQP